MAQFNLDNVVNPETKSGSELASDLTAWRNALHSSHSGIITPPYVSAGMIWVNTAGTPWVLYMYDGADNIAIGTINATTNLFVPGATPEGVFGDIKQIATTTTTGVAELATNGEALAGVEADKIATPAGLASNQDISASGYIELPGGLYMQWGTTPSVPLGGSVAGTWPIAFPTAAFSMTVSNRFRSDNPSDVVSISTTGYTVGLNNTGGGGGGAGPLYFVAFGN